MENLSNYRVYIRTNEVAKFTNKKINLLLKDIDIENKTLIFENGNIIPYETIVMRRMTKLIECVVSLEIYNQITK